MIEIFSEIGNLSIFLILVGCMLYYFGRLIGDTQVERYDKPSYYLEGLSFFIGFVILPLLLGFAVLYIINLKLNILLSYIIQILILSCLSANYRANLLKKHDLINHTKEKICKRLEDIKKKHSFITNFEKKSELDYLRFIIKVWYEIPIRFGDRYILFIFSFLVIYSLISNINFENILYLPHLLLIILTLFNFSLIALAYGYNQAYYPPAKLFLDNGEIIKGKIIKFGDIFIQIVKGNKKIFVNVNHVKYIEESKFKETS